VRDNFFEIGGHCLLAMRVMSRVTHAFNVDLPLRALFENPMIAQLAESVLGRICKVIGGGSFSRSSPFGHWYEDVRALGFLRPPWGLAYDRLFAA